MPVSDNPLLAPEWTTPFGVAPFGEVRVEHFRPAFDAAFAAHVAEIAAIKADPGEPTFGNTIAALERAGRTLQRVSATFWNLTSADTSPELQEIEREIAPRSAKHHHAISTDAALFARIDAVWNGRAAAGLGAEETRVAERYHREGVRAGVALPAEKKARLAAIVERLSSLGTRFSQNVLADEASFALFVEAPGDLDGLPEGLVAAMARAAADRGREGGHAVTLARSIVEPFLTFSPKRDVRRAAYEAWVRRGENGGETDNRAIIAEIVALRAERARLLGFPSFAHYKLEDTMAKTPAAVRDLLDQVWVRGRAKAGQERDALAALAAEEGSNAPIEPWDWRYYAEKVRRARYAFDEAEVKPYLSLDAMIAASFDTASRLFGVRFAERRDVPVYHPDVRVWEVTDAGGRHVGLFVGDYFNRPTKRSGAWMSAFRAQQRLAGTIAPVIVNVMNFAKPAEGKPALLSFDDARTLFHEFGHALHGLMSDVTYPELSGTSVERDFVELPSQLYEHWLLRPEVLSRFARHVETGEPMPQALIAKLEAARTFNQGFQTVEYCASALVDLELHLLEGADGLDVTAFERKVLDRIGMPREIGMRHRTPHFAHVFSGDGYSAGYYSYLWSEVLDADAFDAFTEAGDVFDPAVAGRLLKFVYSAGGTRDPADLYRAFRGRMPSIEPLLEKRGLIAA